MNIKKYYKKIINKKNIVRMVLILWLIFSFVYVIQDQWIRFENGALKDAYMSGRADSVNEMIINLKNEECNSVTVYNEKEKIDVVNVKCLQKTTDQNK